ncbi:MAG: TetR/AcrR family transcriptional regulator [Calothrix sp. SM1_7_51]|nr:TetR/AcrR family transcriptional regulator [Calothrix sp. SM1_7_51]
MPKIVNHELYRQELLGKCFDLFAEKGYSSITMREIARGLGVSTGTLYHYFPSKKSIFEQMVEESVKEDILAATATIEGRKTLIERFQALAEYLEKYEEKIIKQTYIWMDYSQHQDSKDMQENTVWKRIDERYQQAVAHVFGITDPIIGDFISCVIDGIIQQKIWGNERISFKKQFDIMAKMLTIYFREKL